MALEVDMLKLNACRSRLNLYPTPHPHPFEACLGPFRAIRTWLMLELLRPPTFGFCKDPKGIQGPPGPGSAWPKHLRVKLYVPPESSVAWPSSASQRRGKDSAVFKCSVAGSAPHRTRKPHFAALSAPSAALRPSLPPH